MGGGGCAETGAQTAACRSAVFMVDGGEFPGTGMGIASCRSARFTGDGTKVRKINVFFKYQKMRCLSELLDVPTTF